MKKTFSLLFALVLFTGLGIAHAQPVITSQPTNQTVLVGSTANFAVIATGAPPLSYQWVFNSPANPLPGATNNTLPGGRALTWTI